MNRPIRGMKWPNPDRWPYPEGPGGSSKGGSTSSKKPIKSSKKGGGWNG